MTEALRNSSDVTGRVRRSDKSTTLTKGKKPVARIKPVKRMSTAADLLAWLNNPNRARITPEDAEAMERNIKEARKNMLPPVNKWDLY